MCISRKCLHKHQCFKQFPFNYNIGLWAGFVMQLLPEAHLETLFCKLLYSIWNGMWIIPSLFWSIAWPALIQTAWATQNRTPVPDAPIDCKALLPKQLHVQFWCDETSQLQHGTAHSPKNTNGFAEHDYIPTDCSFGCSFTLTHHDVGHMSKCMKIF